MKNFSIIIPHFNNLLDLERCYQSIPKRDDIEILIIDDNSPSEVVSKLKLKYDKCCKLILLDKNHGAGHARNIGLENATGKWILFIDSDDMFAKDAFSYLDKYIDSSFEVIHFFLKSFDTITYKEGVRKITSDLSLRNFYYSNKKNENKFRFKNYACYSKMVKKSFIDKYSIKFEESIVNNDVYYSFQVGINMKKWFIIPHELYCCSFSKNSLTYVKRDIKRQFEFYKMSKERNGFYRKKNLYLFCRYDIIFMPYLFLKRGAIFTFKFYKYVLHNIEEVKKCHSQYLNLIKRDK